MIVRASHQAIGARRKRRRTSLHSKHRRQTILGGEVRLQKRQIQAARRSCPACRGSRSESSRRLVPTCRPSASGSARSARPVHRRSREGRARSSCGSLQGDDEVPHRVAGFGVHPAAANAGPENRRRKPGRQRPLDIQVFRQLGRKRRDGRSQDRSDRCRRRAPSRRVETAQEAARRNAAAARRYTRRAECDRSRAR